MTLNEMKNKFSIRIFTPEALPISLFLTAVILSMFNPMGDSPVTHFDRIIGNGLLYGIDIEKRINKFYMFYLILFPIVFAGIYYLFSLIYGRIKKNNDSQQSAAADYLRNLSVAALIPAVFHIINKFSEDINMAESCIVVFLLCMAFLSLCYILLIEYISINFMTFKWDAFLSFTLVFPVLFLMNSSSRYYQLKFGVVFLIIALSSVFLTDLLYRKKILDDLKLMRIQASAIPLMYGLTAVSLFLEFSNIMNQYNVTVQHKRVVSILLYLVLGLVSILIYFLKGRYKACAFNWEKPYFAALIFSIALVSIQPELQTYINTDLFESANHGLAVNEFFKYGKIPLLENFDAHMLSNSLGNIIYGILNNDKYGAIFTGYGEYITPVLLLLFYRLVGEFFEMDFVFFTTIMLPSILPVAYLDLGFLTIICLLYALRKDTFSAYIIYWISLAGVCIYRLDNGAAYSFATVFTLIIVYFINGRKYNVKRAAAALVTFLSGFGTIYLALCFYKGIDSISRLKEVLAVLKSNINWGYAEMGNTASFAFTFCYLIIPLAVVGISGVLIVHLKTGKVKISPSQGVIVSSLALGYLFNISRGMVRHNLKENSVEIILYSSILFLALAIPLLIEKYKKELFVSLFLLLVTISGLAISNQNIKTDSASDDFFEKISRQDLFDVTPSQKVQRAVPDKKFRKTFDSTVYSIDTIMEPDETYLDFTNQTLLYALAGKEKPVYVNQSPGLLSGEFLQQQFIQEVEASKSKIVFALMPANASRNLAAGIDSIPNAFRYYKISEYISKEFKPFGLLGDYALWVRNDKYEEVKSRCEQKSYNLKEIRIDRESLSNIKTQDAAVKFDNGKLILDSGTKDPQITGLFDNIDMKDYNNKFCEISIGYENNSDGMVQLFYTEEKGENFSNDMSITINTSESHGELRFLIPVTEYTKLRLDPVRGSRMTINKISIKEYSGYVPCDYSYGKMEELHTYQLRQIPFIWGTYDNKEALKNSAISNVVIENDGYYNIDQRKISKESGNYILVKTKSKGAGTCILTLGVRESGNFVPKSIFKFDLSDNGKSNTYLVRISCDFNWYSGVEDCLKISSDVQIEETEIQLLKGD